MSKKLLQEITEDSTASAATFQMECYLSSRTFVSAVGGQPRCCLTYEGLTSKMELNMSDRVLGLSSMR